MSNRADVYVNTRYYESDHGASPRGQGNWGFVAREDYGLDYLSKVVWFTGRYSEAKRFAVRHFATLGVLDVVVCS